MRTPLIRFILTLLVIGAAYGCSDDNGIAPSDEGGVMTAGGTFLDVDDQSEFQAQLQITFESIEEFVEVTGGDQTVRDLTTGPTKIYVRGQDEFLVATAAGLETNPVRLRFRQRSDGICDFVAAMNSQAETGDRFALSLSAHYDEKERPGRPWTVKDVIVASGHMQVTSIQGDVRRSAICNELSVSIRGMETLIEEFEEMTP